MTYNQINYSSTFSDYSSISQVYHNYTQTKKKRQMFMVLYLSI